MSVKIFVPNDATALALGAEAVARAIAAEAKQRSIEIELIRNGSRGLFWLEPLVEVGSPNGRVAYGPVKVADVKSLFDANFVNGNAHPLAQGDIADSAWFKKQDRLTFARVGITDPLSVEDYVAHDGYRGLERALTLTSSDIVKEVTDSGLRGRGGAAFPAGIKWKTVLDAHAAGSSAPRAPGRESRPSK